MNKSPHGHRGAIHSVTNAPISPRDDQHDRMVRYFTSMAIRTLCFVLAFVFIYYLHWMIIGWICAVGALILPYIAVVMANATRGRGVRQASPLTPSGKSRRQLDDGAPTEAQAGGQAGGQSGDPQSGPWNGGPRRGEGPGTPGQGGPQAQQRPPHPSNPR